MLQPGQSHLLGADVVRHARRPSAHEVLERKGRGRVAGTRRTAQPRVAPATTVTAKRIEGGEHADQGQRLRSGALRSPHLVRRRGRTNQ